MAFPQPCSPQYGCPYSGPGCGGGNAPPGYGGPAQPPPPPPMPDRVGVLAPVAPMPFPPQPPGHPSVMWGPLGAAGPCGVPGIPGIHSLTPGYDGYHGFPGYLENPAMRMGKSTLHYGGWGTINSQGKAWTAHFNPSMTKTRNMYTNPEQRYIFGDSLGDRRTARVNEMKMALNRVEMEDKELRTGFSAFAYR